jgi:hypothetical protein
LKNSLTTENRFVIRISFLLFVFPWLQVWKSLSSSHLFYEEASWFDTQIWEKNFFLIRKDRLVASQKLSPIIVRNILVVSSKL